jgi:hypothetical protein
LLDLPGIFGTTLETIPNDVPYLSANRRLVERWRSELAGLAGLRVGISWQGNLGHPKDRIRSIPLREFAPLAELPGVHLVRLQKGPGAEQVKEVKRRWRLVELGPDFDETSGPFMDTAAAMMKLDLVVASDSAVAHLAGAMGVPVWVALPLIPDWRWLLGRSDSPWYPSMRLFRQPTRGDWAGVLGQIAAALRARQASSFMAKEPVE